MITQSKRVALPAWLYSNIQKINFIYFYFNIKGWIWTNDVKTNNRFTVCHHKPLGHLVVGTHTHLHKKFPWKDSNFHHKLRKFAFLPIKLQKKLIKKHHVHFIINTLNNQLWFSKWNTKIIYPAYNKFNLKN